MDELSVGKATFRDKKDLENSGKEFCEGCAYDGKSWAQSALAGYYFNHIEDYQKAIFWARKAAENGSALGMRILSVAYGTGKGVLFDAVEALKWMLLSSCFGDEIAEEFINSCEYKDILPKAKARASEWIELHEDTLYKP